MSVKTTVHPLEGSKVALEVEVPVEEVRRGLDEAYRRLAQRVRIPGFRPGRVPPQVLRARLGQKPIFDEALELLLPRAYREAVEESRVRPVEDPRFDIVQMEEDKPLVFKAEVTVRPQVKLGDYKGVKVDRVVRRVSDADVERVLRRLQERFSVLEPAEGPVQRGVFVELDYDALLDGRPFRGGAARGRTLEVGAERVLPGFDAAIEGMRPGEQRRFELTVPSDYLDKELAGRPLSFTVTVKAVKVKRLPALDDEFARDVGPYESLEQLRATIREELQKLADRRSTSEMRRRLLEKVAQGASVEVPEPMLRRRTDRLIRDVAERLAAQGLTIERYLELTGKSAAELVQSVEPEARQLLVEEMALDAVAEQEDIQAPPEEVERQVEEILAGYREGGEGTAGRRRGEKERLAELREELRESVEASLRRARALDWLAEHAEVSEQVAEGLGEDESAEIQVSALVEQKETGRVAAP